MHTFGLVDIDKCRRSREVISFYIRYLCFRVLVVRLKQAIAIYIREPYLLIPVIFRDGHTAVMMNGKYEIHDMLLSIQFLNLLE